MFRVNNQKVITKLAKKSFQANKSRNTIAIIAIALTSILFTSLFTVGIGIKQSIEKQSILQSGGDGHAVIKYVTEEQYEKIKTHPLIRKIGLQRNVADRVDNPEFLKHPVEMNYRDDTLLAMTYCTPTVGHVPRTVDEIIVDGTTLDMLGIPHKLGSIIPLSYTIKGKHYQTKFVLSGYWTPITSMDVGFACVSDAFVKSLGSQLNYTYDQNFQASGSIQAYMMFGDSTKLMQKLTQVITESGYTIEDDDPATPMQASDIRCNVNWAYMSSSSFDTSGVLAIVLGILLIVLTGYLIIYNIFQISVQRDIRFYGLLKTIGTTGKQLKRIITRQALLLSLIGIPIGLLTGFFIGKAVFPIMMSISSIEAGAFTMKADPMIFTGAVVFSLFTVFISTRRPGKLATQVSPVEAVRQCEASDIKRKYKSSKSGGKLHKMAFSNLARNKKRTIITILSLSLSLVLLNTVFTLSNGFDLDKFLKKSMDSDFILAHANYFNVQSGFHSETDCVSEHFINEVKRQDGFLEGGKLYYHLLGATIHYDIANNAGQFGYVNRGEDGFPVLDLYGLDDLPLSRIDILEGKLDVEKLKSGNYIIEGTMANDLGEIDPKSSHYQIGDTVEVTVGGKTHHYELMAKMKVNHNSNSIRGYGASFIMYLPSTEYLKIASPTVMSYVFNVSDGKSQKMEQFVKRYTENTERTMDYESKQTYVDAFEGLRTVMVTVGGILSIIVGLIGILNFINSTLTGIISRKREFATMQSIGMTKKQLVTMLVMEGGSYAALTILAALLLSILCSVGIVRILISNLWFFSYQFTIVPLMLTFPILLLLAVLIPYIAYRSSDRISIVQQLRESE